MSGPSAPSAIGTDFCAAWVYFVSNILYFPTLLLSGVAMASYMFGESGVKYSENAAYAIPATLAVLWIAILTNLVGLRVGKWPSLLGGAAAYLGGPAALHLWQSLVAWRYGSATHFNHLIPDVSWSNLNFWSQIAFAMVGLELAPILGGEIQNAAKTIPRAAWISGLAVRGVLHGRNRRHAGAASAGSHQSHDRTRASRRCGRRAFWRHLAIALLCSC